MSLFQSSLIRRSLSHLTAVMAAGYVADHLRMLGCWLAGRCALGLDRLLTPKVLGEGGSVLYSGRYLGFNPEQARSEVHLDLYVIVKRKMSSKYPGPFRGRQWPANQ